ncbi:hypothetical protein HHI36_004425 [Cryptolaemus montrouzieri]|uniref:Maturase K n=1 Tax=Cryptolaemus montrouzieri TaxID=559131 RepID=A0ABD2NR47_9CUCU
MYKDLHLLMIEEIIKLHSVKLINKINNDLLLNSDLYGFNTTTKQHFHIIPSATNIGHRRITSRSAIWYNKLPRNIKMATTLPAFVKLVKSYLFRERSVI